MPKNPNFERIHKINLSYNKIDSISQVYEKVWTHFKTDKTVLQMDLERHPKSLTRVAVPNYSPYKGPQRQSAVINDSDEIRLISEAIDILHIKEQNEFDVENKAFSKMKWAESLQQF